MSLALARLDAGRTPIFVSTTVIDFKIDSDTNFNIGSNIGSDIDSSIDTDIDPALLFDFSELSIRYETPINTLSSARKGPPPSPTVGRSTLPCHIGTVIDYVIVTMAIIESTIEYDVDSAQILRLIRTSDAIKKNWFNTLSYLLVGILIEVEQEAVLRCIDVRARLGAGWTLARIAHGIHLQKKVGRAEAIPPGASACAANKIVERDEGGERGYSFVACLRIWPLTTHASR